MKKYMRLVMLLSMSIVLSIIESFIPLFNGFIPGLKLGLANIIVLIVLYKYEFKDVIFVSILRVIVVGIMRTGLFSVNFFFSLSGALFSCFAMALVKKTHLSMIGVSKGYTTQVVSDYLKDNGINYFLINAGGNVSCGDAYGKAYYNIGIQNPDGNGIVSVLKGTNISVVTSGGYERNYEYNGKVYHHIINPNTLFPGETMKSVTVISTDSGISDMLSTTLFLMDVSDALEFLKDYDAEAIFVLNDNSIIKSEGFSKYE